MGLGRTARRGFPRGGGFPGKGGLVGLGAESRSRVSQRGFPGRGGTPLGLCRIAEQGFQGGRGRGVESRGEE